MFMYYQIPLLCVLLIHIGVDCKNVNVDYYAFIALFINMLNVFGYYEF